MRDTYSSKFESLSPGLISNAPNRSFVQQFGSIILNLFSISVRKSFNAIGCLVFMAISFIFDGIFLIFPIKNKKADITSSIYINSLR